MRVGRFVDRSRAALSLAILALALGAGVATVRGTGDLVIVLGGQTVVGTTPLFFNGSVSASSAGGCSATSCFDLPLDLAVPDGYWETVHGGIELTVHARGLPPQDVIGAHVELLGPDGRLFAKGGNAWSDNVAIARGMVTGNYTLRVNATSGTTTFTGLVQREVRARLPAQELLPDLQVLPISGLSTVWTASKAPLSCRPYEVVAAPTQLRCLRFNTTIANFGPGRLELVIPRADALTGAATGNATFTQRVEVTDDSTHGYVVGPAVFHAGHNHYHYADFVSNKLYAYDVAAHQRGSLAVEGRKEGFCPADSGLIALGLPDTEEPATSACRVTDGSDIVLRTESNYYDTYTANIDDQEIDITNVPAGVYELVTTVNPDATIHETSTLDNAQSAFLRIDADGSVHPLAGPP